jgi:hypothetical protein
MIPGLAGSGRGTAAAGALEEVTVVTRAQVLDLVHRGRSYFQAGNELGVPAGQAYLVATGLPADGSAALTDGDFDRPGAVRGSTQALANPPHVNPTVKPEVLAWVKDRAARDLTTHDTAPLEG